MEQLLFNPLIITRDIHFATSIMVAGLVFFDLFVAAPIFESDSRFKAAERAFRSTAEKVLWISLALSVASALAWLFLLSIRISQRPLGEVVTDGTAWTLLSQTQFGLAWQIRLASAAALAMCLWWKSKTSQGRIRILASLLVAAYVASLAFSGHGEEGLGDARLIHLAADALHLMAAALWLGALIPFALMLGRLYANREEGWVSAASAAGHRFSALGVIAVATLLVSGTINASFLLVGLHSLIDAPYGRLLLLKIVLFATMLGLAGVNRQYLLPKLCEPAENYRIFRRLVRNSLMEIALGLAIILIVGTLGVMPPANQIMTHVH